MSVKRAFDFPYLIAGPGKIIAVNKKFCQTFAQYIHSIGHTPRWRGLGVGPHEYSVLHHVVVVAMLNASIHSHKDRVYAFWKGVLHELGETFYGDVPTPFKTGEIRKAEERICIRFSEKLAEKWQGYYGVRMRDTNVKVADLAVAEIEAPFVLGISQDEVEAHGLISRNTTDAMRTDARLLYRAIAGRPVGELKLLLNTLFDRAISASINKSCQRAWLDEFNGRILR